MDLQTGELREHDALLTDVVPPPTGASGRFTCSWGVNADGQTQMVITDTQTGQQTAITEIYMAAGGPSCPTDSDPTLMVWRFAGGRVALWTGPFDAIAPAPVDQDLVVSQVISFSLRRGATNVIAAPADQPEALGIYRIDLASFAVTTIVPATLAGAAWAPGVAPMGDLVSSSLSVPGLSTSSEIPTAAFGDRFIYRRAMSDGSTVTFVGPYADGPARELALFRRSTTATTRVRITPTSPVRLAWIEADVTVLTRTLRLYDDARRQVMSCALSNEFDLVGVGSADGADVLFSPEPDNPNTYWLDGPVTMMTPALAAADGTGACAVFAEGDALAAGRSPDDTWLYWLLDPPDSADNQLWIAARDGSGRRLLGTDEIAGPPWAPRFVGDSQLQFRLGGDLSWLDVRDDPVRMHYITENVFGTAIRRRPLAGDRIRVQRSGRDRAAGRRQPRHGRDVAHLARGRALCVARPEHDANARRRPRGACGVRRARPQPVAARRAVAGDHRRRCAPVTMTCIAAAVLLMLAGDAGADGGADAGADATAAQDAAPLDATGAEAHDGARGDATGDTRPVPPPAVTATVPLRGRVLQKGTRRPLAGVSIAVDGAAAAETGQDGRFELRVSPGAHRLQIQLTGHEDADQHIDAAAGGGAEVLFRLAPRLTGERYETTVRPARAEIPRVEVSGDEARAVAGTSGDPLRVIGSLPGVSQIVWPAAIYVVRGANPGNTGFYLDGLRVPALFHLALGPSLVHPYLMSGVDFYPGGYPASFGGFVSGIMSARTSAPPADRVRASADVTVYDAGGIMSAPWNDGRGTVAVAARYSYTGALFSVLQAENTLRYGDYQLRADHPLAGGQATVFAFGSLDELGWLNYDQQEYGALQFHRLDLRWRRALGGGRLAVANTLGADWSRSTLFDRPIQMRALSVAPRIAYEHAFGPVDLIVGGDANAQDFQANVPEFGRRPSDLSRSRGAFTQGTFATLAIRAGRRVTMSPGVRGDVFAEQGVRRTAVQPRLDVLFQATDTLAFKVNGGRFAQMPSLPVSVAGFEAFGLADLGLQTSVGGSLGVQARLPRDVIANVTGYFQRLRLTDVRDIDLMSLDPGAPDFLVSRRGRAYGVELLVRRADRGRLFGWLAYTLSWSLREDDNGVFGRSDWDQRHILNLVGGYRLRGGYSVGARFHLNTGRLAPVIGSRGEYQQLPVFYQLDLRFERRFVFDRFMMSLYADFANATLTREVVQVVYAYDYNTSMRVVQEQSFHLILAHHRRPRRVLG